MLRSPPSPVLLWAESHPLFLQTKYLLLNCKTNHVEQNMEIKNGKMELQQSRDWNKRGKFPRLPSPQINVPDSPASPAASHLRVHGSIDVKS